MYKFTSFIRVLSLPDGKAGRLVFALRNRVTISRTRSRKCCAFLGAAPLDFPHRGKSALDEDVRSPVPYGTRTMAASHLQHAASNQSSPPHDFYGD